MGTSQAEALSIQNYEPLMLWEWLKSMNLQKWIVASLLNMTNRKTTQSVKRSSFQ